MKFIKKFKEISLADIGLVGGKNASLGQMIQNLSAQVNIPDGFAITAGAYRAYLEHNKFMQSLHEIMGQLDDMHDIKKLQQVGAQARDLIITGTLPQELVQEITESYHNLSQEYKQQNCDVAVRSSATAEDLPEASFAGQQESYLNISGIDNLLAAYKKCIASLFTDRAIAYRREHNFDDFAVEISVGVQKMVRADLACSGVMFTLDTESGFKDIVSISAAYGLGENIVKGIVNPDEFYVHKPTKALIKKSVGTKTTKLMYVGKNNQELKNIPVSVQEQMQFSLTDQEILELAHYAIIIENYYSEHKGAWSPMDIEWAKDGLDGKLYIVQARPETVHAREKHAKLIRYKLTEKPTKTLVTGQSIGQKIVSGPARVVKTMQDLSHFNNGDILVTQMTDPDWVPIMKKAAGIVTDLGGRTCHAAIVSRELGIPAIIGTELATTTIKDGQLITLDCSLGSRGLVYDGLIGYEKEEFIINDLPESSTPLLINLADPERAFETSFLPVDGVGLARLEFIINTIIKVHPMAIAQPEKITDPKIIQQIHTLAAAYKNPAEFFITTLAQAVGMIAAAFFPKPVIVRLTDFKSNEYRDLLGGDIFEPREENPMLGFRGAVRYCDNAYAPAFALECAALKKARQEMGLSNIKIMVPFVRTVTEARATIQALAQHGLVRGQDGLEIFMMVEIPSNVILINDFAEYFDGFSIGSNDLTQLTLGVDRDSGLLSHLFDERDPAVKKMLEWAVVGAHQAHKYIGICGQAPSDFPEIADFLMGLEIDSLSLNPDSVIPFLMRLK